MSSKNLIGMKFGRLTPIKIVGKTKNEINVWECKCDCGKYVNVPTNALTTGHTKSCGCYQKFIVGKLTRERSITHNLSHSTLYKKWCGIKRRCYNPHDKRYKNYGGRGIKMCSEWQSNFINFYTWSLQNGYKEGLTIDRKNVNGNYEPSNCRWIPMEQQAANKRNNHYFEYGGKKHTIAEWSQILGINAKTLYTRFERKGNIDLEDEIQKKMERNKLRPYKHGKAF